MDVIERNIKTINGQIAKACENSGRDKKQVHLICVSKTHSKQKIIAAYKAGARLFGENKVQEALEKFPLGEGFEDAQLHYIGRLQSNKVRKIYPITSVFHSIDSLKILKKLESLGEEFKSQKKVFLQVNISAEESKAGFRPEEMLPLIPQLADFRNIQFCGLMGIGPNTSNLDEVAKSFGLLSQLLKDIREKYAPHFPFLAHFKELSMGMSHDFPIAIEQGSHYLRVGTAIFGDRDYGH